MFTDEQQAIIESDAKRLRVIAFAGTGKTSTLVGYARAREDKMLYLAYNKSIQLEAQRKFPPNVLCRTTHALAFPTFGKRLAHKLGNMRIGDVAEHLRVSFAQASFVASTVNNFLSSADAKLGETHLPKEANRSDFIECNIVVDGARKLLARMQNPADNSVPATHDVYLKQFVLAKPTLPADIVLFDEAQDSNPITSALVLAHKGPLVMVGDGFQGIYGFRGARDALAEIENAQTYALTRSFRFGQPVADIANGLLSYLGETRAIVGAGRYQNTRLRIREDERYALVARTNMTIIEAAIRTLPDRLRSHYVGGVEGTKLPMIEDGYRLLRGRKEEIRERFLRKFDSISALSEYAQEANDIEMKILCNIVMQYTDDIPEIVRKIRALAVDTIGDAQRIFTTAHKSKGLEFDAVMLADDFADLTDCGSLIPVKEIDRQEVHLHYVAATRAIEALSINQQLADFAQARAKTTKEQRK